MKISKSIILFVLFLSLGCKTEKNHSQTQKDNTSKKISDFNLHKIAEFDSIIKNYLIEKRAVGIEFGIQIGEASPIVKQYGYADLATKRELEDGDLFRIASITKIFTGTAVMKLVEEEKISLNDKLNKFFPKYTNGENITIYQLLSHTSGIPNWWDGVLPKDTPNDFPMSEEPHQYLQKMKNQSIFKPGEYYSYSNSNYVLLGEIIEKVSGQSYESFLMEKIFKPAKMTSTETEYIEHPSASWVKGYAFDDSKENPFTAPEVYHMPFAAGGLRSNSNDLLKFIVALSSGRIVKEETFHKMTEYALLGNGKPVYEGKYSPPGAEPSKTRAYRTKFGYGLGFHLVELYGKTVYYHSGGIAGFNSYLMYFPHNNTTMTLLANTEDGIVPLLNDLRKIGNEIKFQK